MSRKVLLVAFLSAFIVGCGSDRGSVDPVASSNGTASISGQAVVGQTLSASATDPDGIESVNRATSGTQMALQLVGRRRWLTRLPLPRVVKW